MRARGQRGDCRVEIAVLDAQFDELTGDFGRIKQHGNILARGGSSVARFVALK